MRVAVLVLALCAALANPALGFYLPGVAPQDYARVRGAPRPSAPDQHFHFHGSPTFSRFSSHAFDPIRAPPHHPTLTPNPPIDHQDDLINFKVNSIRSDKALPMEYYKLPYCQPDHIVSSAENLGEVLRGDRIFNSLYQIQMRLDERCKVVCRVVALTPPQVKQIHEAIEYEYRVNMILDNLPAAEVRQHLDETGAPVINEETGLPRKYYERGFPVGIKVSESEDGPHSFYINNHAR
jgi:transmembrane 9 superfamily protein 2/4